VIRLIGVVMMTILANLSLFANTAVNIIFP